MNFFALISVLSSSFFSCFSQVEEQLSIEIGYGLAGNHFVRSYDENGVPGAILLSEKDFLGTASQILFNYRLKNNTVFSLGYARDSHQGERDVSVLFNGVPVFIDSFSVRHNNNIYISKHKRNINDHFKYYMGVFYLRPEQQEISIGPSAIILDERDQPNNRLNDGGVLGGVSYERKVDTRFTANLSLTGYYLASASTYETTYLTAGIAYDLLKN